MRRRYDLIVGGSRSFWEISLRGRRVSVRYGRAGTDGRRESWSHETAEEARQDFERRVAEKTSEGYEVAFSDDEEKPSDSCSLVTDAALEAEIAADPDDLARFLVYGDWLTERGDPRGPLIALQASLEGENDPNRFLEVQTRAREHLALHQRVILGGLFEHQADLTLRWRRGYIDELRVRASADVPSVVSAISTTPAAAILRQLVVDVVDEYAASVLVEQSFPVLRTLDLAWAYEDKRLSAGPSHAHLCRRIFARELAPELRRLILARTPNTNALCEELVCAELAGQLEHIDLDGGNLTTDGLEFLYRAKKDGRLSAKTVAAQGQHALELLGELFEVTRPKRRKK